MKQSKLSAHYAIRVKGTIGERWQAWFEDMQAQVNEDTNEGTVTVLTGLMTDQAALMGTLQKLSTLGFTVIDVHQISEEGEDNE